MLFEEEAIMKNIQHVLDRIDIYEKKSISMGLTTDEERLYTKLAVQYVRLRLYLFDTIFNKYILSDIVHGEAEKIANKIYNSIGWNLDILANKEEMDAIYNKYGSRLDKSEILSDIKKLFKILRRNLMEKYMSLDDREIWECISVLISDGGSKSPKILVNHLSYKLESIYMILKEEEEE